MVNQTPPTPPTQPTRTQQGSQLPTPERNNITNYTYPPRLIRRGSALFINVGVGVPL